MFLSVEGAHRRYEMPLTLTELRSKGELDQQRQAIGIWVRDARQVQIRVFVTCEALQQLEPAEVPDLYGWSETFSKLRALIVRVASDKFDRIINLTELVRIVMTNTRVSRF
jgi:Protein of unknown function (DUF1488)